MKKNLVETNKPGVYKMVTEPDDYFGEDCYDWSEYGTFEMAKTRLPNGKHCIDILFRPNEEDSNVKMGCKMPFVNPKSPILLKVMDLKTCKKYIKWMMEFYQDCRRNGELGPERRSHTVTFTISRDDYNLILSNVPDGESISGYLREMLFARMHNPNAKHLNRDAVEAPKTITAGISMTDIELAEFDEFCKRYKASRASMMRKLIFLDSQKLQAL